MGGGRRRGAVRAAVHRTAAGGLQHRHHQGALHQDGLHRLGLRGQDDQSEMMTIMANPASIRNGSNVDPEMTRSSRYCSVLVLVMTSLHRIQFPTSRQVPGLAATFLGCELRSSFLSTLKPDIIYLCDMFCLH